MCGVWQIGEGTSAAKWQTGHGAEKQQHRQVAWGRKQSRAADHLESTGKEEERAADKQGKEVRVVLREGAGLIYGTSAKRVNSHCLRILTLRNILFR